MTRSLAAVTLAPTIRVNERVTTIHRAGQFKLKTQAGTIEVKRWKDERG
ncbi:MAG TPA: hypothetical protein VMM58_03690 [Bacteroidota bacterium]|nr:hypothetical protein [Bacteroidota bacterium]